MEMALYATRLALVLGINFGLPVLAVANAFFSRGILRRWEQRLRVTTDVATFQRLEGRMIGLGCWRFGLAVMTVMLITLTKGSMASVGLDW